MLRVCAAGRSSACRTSRIRPAITEDGSRCIADCTLVTIAGSALCPARRSRMTNLGSGSAKTGAMAKCRSADVEGLLINEAARTSARTRSSRAMRTPIGPENDSATTMHEESGSFSRAKSQGARWSFRWRGNLQPSCECLVASLQETVAGVHWFREDRAKERRESGAFVNDRKTRGHRPRLQKTTA